MLVMDGPWRILVGSEPREYKRDLLAFANSNLRDSSQVLAAGFNRRSQDQAIRSGDRFQAVIPLANPWHDLPVIKPDDQFHLHRHLAAQPFHDPDDVRILATWRHEIDQTHSAALGFNFRFENKRVPTVTAAGFYDFFLWEKPPMPVSRIAQKRGETRRRIEPRKTKPINASVPAHQSSGLRIAKKRIVLDLCPFARHLAPRLVPAATLDRLDPTPLVPQSHHEFIEPPSIHALVWRRARD